jgi:mannose-6-phosphate isomerase
MIGFREPAEIKNLLERFLGNASYSLKIVLKPLINSLEGEEPLKNFLAELFSLSVQVRDALNLYAQELGNHENSFHEWKIISQFAAAYPGDPAIISPLYLNLIHLNPGEAIYLPDGILHAYIYGLGVELMANSNNVLRGGLTSKHVDIPELLRVLDFTPYKPEILEGLGDSYGEHEYPVPCREFSLSVFRGGENIFLETGPSIILVTEGKLEISRPGSDTRVTTGITLKQGESAFIPAGNRGLIFSGNYTVYAAGTGLLPKSDDANPDSQDLI